VSACRKSHARIPDAWEARNCRQVGDARRGEGVSPAAARIPADRSRADAMAETEEFALDAPVPPPWILIPDPRPRQQIHCGIR
jgi:hypothetical protein